VASVHQKTGANGERSPNWNAKIKGLGGAPKYLTTKEPNKKTALKIADKWEEAFRLAENEELTQPTASKITEAIKALKANPETMALTRALLDELLLQTTGQELKGQDFEQFCKDWLKGKVKIAPSTYDRYALVLRDFIKSLPERRRNVPVASITPLDVTRFRDAEFKSGKTAVTVNMEVTILGGVFNAARRQQLAHFSLFRAGSSL
jgi:hypothetical protein